MLIDRYPVRLVSTTKGEVDGLFVLGEHVYGDHVTLTLQFAGSEITSQATDYFEAMCRIRDQLEADGWRPMCYGSSRNVYPSGMGRGMGLGLKAYKTQPGKRAFYADLVKIFDVGPVVEPCSVAEQKQFHQEWLRSLGLNI
jgi:hypothetical protein